MVGPVVHGCAIASPVFLVGQAPGPHEGRFGKPFAWTAGRTLFRWLGEALQASEEEIRSKIYFAAVARCFPGKAPGGGDRKPDAEEIDRCKTFLEKEVAILQPRLVLPVGTLAIEQVLGPLLGKKFTLAEVIGTVMKTTYHGQAVEVIALPHPSGASTWFKVEPGKTLLLKALQLVANHPVLREQFPRGPRLASADGNEGP
jgi:uracil-DNA glycosylase